MIELFLLLLGFFFSYKIYVNRGSYVSLLWVMIPMILVNGMIKIVDFPFTFSISRWLIFSLLVIQLVDFDRFKLNWRKFPLRNIVLISGIASVAIGVFDPRMSPFQKFSEPFREICNTFFILFLGYTCTYKSTDIYKIIKPLYYTMIIVGLYGVFNFITKSNPYYEFVLNNLFQGGEDDMNLKMKVLTGDRDRFRAVSTFDMTFNYGYVSTLLALFFLFALSIIKNKKIATIGFIACLIGSILCFSRTVLIAGFIAIIVNIVVSNKLSNTFRVFFVSTFIGIVAYFSIATFQTSVDNVLDLFISGGENTSGSSVSMRAVQTEGAIRYFMQSPIRGNGYRYIKEDLGWGDRDSVNYDEDMAGFESIIYVLLIEQGLMGLITKLLFFIALIVHFCRSQFVFNKRLKGLGLSIICLFLVFSIGTGALGAWPMSMLLLGVIIKTMQINVAKRKNRSLLYPSKV